MADDVPTISTSRVPASEVSRRSFGPARRGFDPEEVRAYLELVARELLAAERREQELLHELADAEERARHPVIDESVLTSSLGQRSAGVLRSAHDEAAVISQRAEEAAATLVHEAHQQATEIAVRAESAGAERIAEAELAANSLRHQARDEASAVLESARSEGEALVERAREHGRAMVEQAQEARRRVLADLGLRRRAVTDQIEQFRAARDEVASSVLGVRGPLDRIVDDLGRADDAARAAAEAARHQGGAGSEAALVAEAEQAAAELGLDTGGSLATGSLGAPTGEHPAFEPAPDIVAEPSGSAGSGLGDPEAGGTAETDVPSAGSEPPSTGPRTVPSGGSGPVPPGGSGNPSSSGGGAAAASSRGGDVMLRFDDLSPASDPLRSLEITAVGAEEVAAAGDVAVEDDVVEEAAHPDDVEGLFARLRARQEDTVTTLEQPVVSRQPSPPSAIDAPVDTDITTPSATLDPSAGGAPVSAAAPESSEAPAGETTEEPSVAAEEPSEAEEVSPDRAALDRRAEVLDPIVTTMARRLKRVLQDDQNRLLDRLRKGTGEWSDDLLADEATQRGSFAKAASGSVRDAVAVGIAFSRAASHTRQGRAPTPDPQTVEAVTDELASTVVTLLRRRLEGTDVPDAAERIGAAYREWRGERIERLALDRAVEAFSAGVLAGVGRGVHLRWVRNDASPGCADCEDNALAGLVEPGEEFPTGHRYPPAHAGCSCLVLPTPA